MEKNVSIGEKPLLHFNEAAILFNVGENKLRELCAQDDSLVLKIGNRKLIKKDRLVDFLKDKDKI